MSCGRCELLAISRLTSKIALLRFVLLRNGQSTVGEPKWTFQVKMDHFGPFWSPGGTVSRTLKSDSE